MLRKNLDPIPGNQCLWRAINKASQLYSDGRPKPSFFRDRSGTSCDLKILTSAKRILKDRPEGAGIVEFTASDVSEASEGLACVKHKPLYNPPSPIRPNYAHCEIHPGDLRTEEQRQAQQQAAAELELSRRAKIVVKPDIQCLRNGGNG